MHQIKSSAAVPSSQRNSAVELLRILAMLMIVLSHICHHSGYDYTYSPMTVNRLFVQFGILGNLGVDIFVMLSGYFLCTKPFRMKNMSRLFSQVWFYSIGIFLIYRFGFGVEFSSDQLLQIFFPTIYAEYWFFTAYIMLLLLTPFLNLLVGAMSRSQFKMMLVCMIAVWVGIPTVTNQQMGASEIPQFVMFYMLGAYFRAYPENRFCGKKLQLGLGIGSLLLLYALTVVLGYLERYTPEAFGASSRFYARNSLFIVGSAVGMFAMGVNCKPFHNRFVNTISGCTFGVYLIHEHPVIRDVLWKEYLNHAEYFTSGSFIVRLLASVVLVFAGCTAVEYLRQKTVAKPMTEFVDKVFNGIARLITSVVH